GVFDFFQLEWLDNRLDFLHERLPPPFQTCKRQIIIAESSFSHNRCLAGNPSLSVRSKGPEKPHETAAGVRRRTTGRSILLQPTNTLKVNVQLDGPLPLAVDDVVVEPHRSGQETDVFGEVVVHPEPAAANEV